MNGEERTNYPIPPDPDFGYCQVDYMTGGQWTTCGEYADEEVNDTLMCPEHIKEHQLSEEADNARKGRLESQ